MTRPTSNDVVLRRRVFYRFDAQRGAHREKQLGEDRFVYYLKVQMRQDSTVVDLL